MQLPCSRLEYESEVGAIKEGRKEALNLIDFALRLCHADVGALS
jgi:hypothetical protein